MALGASASGTQKILRYVYITSSLLIVLSLIPTNQKFKYDFEVGKPWLYEDLLAPFSYPIVKSDSKLDEEKEAIRNDFEPYYEVNTKVSEQALQMGLEYIDENIGQYGDEIDNVDAYKKAVKKIIGGIYETGLIELEPKHREDESLSHVKLLKNKVSTSTSLSSLYTLQEVKETVQNKVASYDELNNRLLTNAILLGLQPNIAYQEKISKEKLEEELSLISKNLGMVEAGELIIQKGLTVTEDEYQKLQSLKTQYTELVKAEGQYLHLSGYAILIISIFIIYIGYIQLFQIELMRRNRRLLLMLINIVLFVSVSRYVIQNENLSIYVVPYCIIPIVALAFFDYKLALISHIVVILLVGSFVPTDAAEFIIIQLLAGFVAILSMLKVQYLSQFFISNLFVFISYLVTFMAFQLIESSKLNELNYVDFLWLGGNFMLTLLGYPLIYAYEKMFGFVSDITLVELADVNKKLLRKLSVHAPGTFQHSLQVANLSESVINQIGGKPLLTRVGALYHDIGKMRNPEYFIENQKYIKNPHDALGDEESAKVIIDHVTEGVKLAQTNGIPRVIVEFIKTHHGTSRVEYFYRNYLKKVPANQVDETKFRYPGPKPATREMSVVMICDAVEAATRSVKEKDQDKISTMIDSIINGKLSDHQFDKAPLTVREIEQMRSLLKELVNSMYHVRIAYPEE